MGKRGIRKHQKRLSAPRHWMLSKVGGIWATKPCQGPHKLRESLPLLVLLRNKLKLALTGREAKMIVKEKTGNIAVDGRPRTNPKYPVGFMDVITLLRTNSSYRLLYDVKGRFKLLKISKDEAQYKLCKVLARKMGDKGIPHIITNDGRTIRFPNPEIKENDTIKLNLNSGEIVKSFKYKVGNKVMIVGGNNIGRIGTIDHIEKHPGSYEIVYVKDLLGHSFSTRLCNIFVIGEKEPEVSVLKNHTRYNILEEKAYRLSKLPKEDEDEDQQEEE